MATWVDGKFESRDFLPSSSIQEDTQETTGGGGTTLDATTDVDVKDIKSLDISNESFFKMILYFNLAVSVNCIRI